MEYLIAFFKRIKWKIRKKIEHEKRIMGAYIVYQQTGSHAKSYKWYDPKGYEMIKSLNDPELNYLLFGRHYLGD